MVRPLNFSHPLPQKFALIDGARPNNGNRPWRVEVHRVVRAINNEDVGLRESSVAFDEHAEQFDAVSVGDS
jgi:hypothetical protein